MTSRVVSQLDYDTQDAVCKTNTLFEKAYTLSYQQFLCNHSISRTVLSFKDENCFMVDRKSQVSRAECAQKTIYLFIESCWQANKTFFRCFSVYSRLNDLKKLFMRFHPLNFFVLTCIIFSLFFCNANASPMRGTNTLMQTQHKPNLYTVEEALDDNRKQTILNSIPQQSVESELVLRSKRSVNTENVARKNQQKTKTRKTKKTNGEKKRKRKRKAKRKARKTKVNKMLFSDNIMTMSNNQPDMPSSPRRQRLYNRVGTSFHLAVWKNGTVSGEPSEKRSKYSVLEVRGVAAGGTVTIMGVATKKYICVTKKGVVKAKKKYNKSRCRFQEKILQNKRNTYQSLSCKRCFLNLSKKGKMRRLHLAKPQLPQAHFLPRHLEKSRVRNFLASKRDDVISIDFSVYNDTKLSLEKLESLLRNKTNIAGVAFQKTTELSLGKGTFTPAAKSLYSHQIKGSKISRDKVQKSTKKFTEKKRSKLEITSIDGH